MWCCDNGKMGKAGEDEGKQITDDDRNRYKEARDEYAL
jgi:hypothetical protein